MDGEWLPTRDLGLIVWLHRGRYPGLYEFAEQYAGLQPRDLARQHYRCWVYRQGGRPLGFAAANLNYPGVAYFDELWCEFEGQADIQVERWARADLGRLAAAHRLLVGFGRSIHRRVTLRAPPHNPLGALLGRRYALPLVNVHMLATRAPHPLPALPLPPGYAIRPYRRGDEGAYAATFRASFNQDLAPGAFRRWATGRRAQAYSAIRHDRVVGSLIADERRGGIADFNLMVDRRHWGRGLATALLAAGMDYLRGRDVTTVVADHWASNARAAAFYRRHDFRVGQAYNFLQVV